MNTGSRIDPGYRGSGLYCDPGLAHYVNWSAKRVICGRAPFAAMMPGEEAPLTCPHCVKRLRDAGPLMPVEIRGFKDLPPRGIRARELI